MLKNASYKEKFMMLKPLLSILVEDIKTDIKNEHLKNDILFCKQYMPGKNIAKATAADLAEAYAAGVRKFRAC